MAPDSQESGAFFVGAPAGRTFLEVKVLLRKTFRCFLRRSAVEPYAFVAAEGEPGGIVVRKHRDDPASLAENRRDAVRGMSAGEDVQRPAASDRTDTWPSSARSSRATPS